MADDSPGKVQALRAIFSEKNTPLMGMLPLSGKIQSRPWRTAVSSTEDLKEKKFNELRLGNKVLPTPEKNQSSLHRDIHKDINGSKNIPKPTVGPKPFHLVQPQQRIIPPTSSEQTSTESDTVHIDESFQHRTFSEGETSKTKAFGETIASFMFTVNNKDINNSIIGDYTPHPVPNPRTSQIQKSPSHMEIMNLCNSQSLRLETQQSCNIGLDNYICKSSYQVRRTELPPQAKLGPAPFKLARPPHLILPQQYSPSSSSMSVSSSQLPPPTLPQKPIPQRPSYPCPPRPQTPPPLPPILKSSLREELEELYEDTIQEDHKGRPTSLIPEYTEEEEEAEELYNDAAEEVKGNSKPSESILKYKKPPPPAPSEYLQPNNSHSSNEELYQDADRLETEEFYEVMPCDEIPDESGSPLYSNNKKEIEKLKKEEEKRMRREQKENDKKEKEMEKLKKKFGLSGGEMPIDDGLVKCDSRGGKGDLPVKKGETVLILRMEGNPSGRWLVKNEKGKIGYVELTNIEVDPLSVKSVMSIRRVSVISNGEELYCEAKSEEAIYEVTY